MPRRNNTPRHNPFQPPASCAHKRRFKTEKLAAEAADTRMLIVPALELSVYQCDMCGGWHLTRQSRK
jgi:hypothetical protein